MQAWTTPEERQRFIQDQGIIYLGRAELTDHPSFRRELNQSPYYRENREEFDRLTALYGQDILDRNLAALAIRYIGPDVGYGLFAEKDLAPGSFIGEYAGILQEGREAVPPEDRTEPFETDYTWDYPDAWYEDILFEVNALRKGNELRYVNHSFDPNLAVEHTLLENRWVIFFIAEHAIRRGTQLTVDYGEEYWSGGFRELVLF